MHKAISSAEIRELFLEFFEEKDHLRIPAARLIPNNDPTLLYINSGMAAMKGYFTGEDRPPHPNLCNVQPCIRTRDIDDVGDRHHLTFFEMLGSWSIGDYFKERAIELAYELLVERLIVLLELADPLLLCNQLAVNVRGNLVASDDKPCQHHGRQGQSERGFHGRYPFLSSLPGGMRSRTLSTQPYSIASAASSHLLRSQSRSICSRSLPVPSASIW